MVVAGGGKVGAALASPSSVDGAEANAPPPAGPREPMAGGALAMLLRGEALPTTLLLPSRASLTVLGAAGGVPPAAPPPATLLPPGGDAPPATLAGALKGMVTGTGLRTPLPSAECNRCGRPRGGETAPDRMPAGCARYSPPRGDTALDGGRDDTSAQLLRLVRLSLARCSSGDGAPAANVAPGLLGELGA